EVFEEIAFAFACDRRVLPRDRLGQEHDVAFRIAADHGDFSIERNQLTRQGSAHDLKRGYDVVPGCHCDLQSALSPGLRRREQLTPLLASVNSIRIVL